MIEQYRLKSLYVIDTNGRSQHIELWELRCAARSFTDDNGEIREFEIRLADGRTFSRFSKNKWAIKGTDIEVIYPPFE